MGRFSIGARVRDPDGDEGVIVGKPSKGYRTVAYEGLLAGLKQDRPKKSLTPVEADTAPAAQEQWQPKVGDRVIGTHNKIEYDVDAVNSDGTIDVSCLGIITGNTLRYTKKELSLFQPLPVAEQPAETLWAPVVGKYGKTRDGRKVGPLTNDTSIGVWAFEAEVDGSVFADGTRCAWRADGSFDPYDAKKPHRLDLVSEWVDDAPVVAVEAVEAEGDTYGITNAKPGDVYLCVKWCGEMYTAGKEYRFGDDGNVVDDRGTARPKIYAGTWRFLRNEPTPERKFKVGDVVNWTRVRGEFDGSTIEGYEGIVFDWKLRATNGKHTYAFSSELELVTPEPVTPTESFIVARLTAKGEPRPNVRPRVHASLEAAEAEAQRLADRLGDEFAVYQRVATRTVDAGPVPGKWGAPFSVVDAKAWLKSGYAHAGNNGMAFAWSESKQGSFFWGQQATDGLTHLGRAILKKWIAEAEAANDNTKAAA